MKYVPQKLILLGNSTKLILKKIHFVSFDRATQHEDVCINSKVQTFCHFVSNKDWQSFLRTLCVTHLIVSWTSGD